MSADDIHQAKILTGQAERAMSALVPLWDALADTGRRDDYQAITAALRVIMSHIDDDEEPNEQR